MSYFSALGNSKMNRGFGGYNKLSGNTSTAVQQAVETPKHKYNICMNKNGYVATFDMDGYKEGDDVLVRAYSKTEMSHGALVELADLLSGVPDNDILTDTIALIYVPDALQYLVNGTIADYIRLGRDKQGTIIPNEKLALMKEVIEMLHNKWMNVIIRPYTMASQEVRSAAKNWMDTISRQKAAEAVGGITQLSKQPQQTEAVAELTIQDKINKFETTYIECLANGDVKAMIRIAKTAKKLGDKNGIEVDFHADNEVTLEEINDMLEDIGKEPLAELYA